MKTTKLYYSPGSVSLAVQILLRECGRDFELVATPTGDDAHLSAEYLALNPVGRIPTLVVGDQTLTETPAILRWLGRSDPQSRLYPKAPWAQARCDEILSRIASLAHPAFRMAVRPDRIIGADAGEHALQAVRAAGRRDFCAALDHLERDLPDAEYALGDDFTIADPYLSLMYLWARFIDADISRLPKMAALTRRVMARESAQQARVAEGLVDAEGRPTPPTRV